MARGNEDKIIRPFSDLNLQPPKTWSKDFITTVIPSRFKYRSRFIELTLLINIMPDHETNITFTLKLLPLPITRYLVRYDAVTQNEASCGFDYVGTINLPYIAGALRYSIIWLPSPYSMYLTQFITIKQPAGNARVSVFELNYLQTLKQNLIDSVPYYHQNAFGHSMLE